MRFSVLVSLLGPTIACGPPPLANTHRSPEDLGRAVLDALARRDETALGALALNEQEFRAYVWPSLPAARPERNLPFSYVWGDLRQKSNLSLARTLDRYGGRPQTLRHVTFAGTTPYGHCTVHRDASVAVDDASGVAQTIRACGSFLEKDGVWKVFSYVVD